jgi:phosphoglycerol geranylgeranyltransferase
MIYKDILEKAGKRKLFALLIDPAKHSAATLREAARVADQECIDFIFIGGSLVSAFPDESISLIKEETRIPVIIFPGSLLQISNKADGLLLLSLISGRNPEYLIGNHVIAAPMLKNTGLEIIPAGYILIENGTTSSVEYISNTKPIPAQKPDLVIATAMAGEMMGLKVIYLEGGSGSSGPIDMALIRKVKEHIAVPLIVGGGLKSREDVQNVYSAGADIVVVGNALENDLSSLKAMAAVRNEFQPGKREAAARKNKTRH